MRCKIHPSDSGAGVCACCLRERLSALTVSASPMKSQKPDPSAAPPAILCSRSSLCNASGPSHVDHGSCSDGRTRCAVKFSLLSPFFGNPNPEKTESNDIAMKPSLSSSWYLALIVRQWRKKKKKSPHVSPHAGDSSHGRSMKSCMSPENGRGMSPASRDVTEEDNRHLSTPPPLRRNAHRQQSPCKLSSYALCMSPMLRPISGNRQNNCPSMALFSDDIRRTFDRRWSTVGVAFSDASSALAPNRSRKLVDLGKAW